MIDKCRRKIEDYKQIVNALKDEVKLTRDSVIKSNNFVVDDVKPTLVNILSLMEERKALQLQANKKLQNQIIELKKEKAELVQNIIQCKKKVDELQKDLGRYPGDKQVKSKLGIRAFPDD